MGGTRRILAATVVAAGLLAVPGVRGDMITHSATTVNMAFVDIGSAGNAADNHGAGYGSVGYTYRMGTYEVSAAQWETVRAVAGGVGNAGSWVGSQPTAGTSWYEAARFCNWLTTGNVTTGVYTLNGDSVTSIMDHQVAGTTYGTAYFLPTENEWYKAAYYNPSNSTYNNYATGSDALPTAVASGTTPGTAVYTSEPVTPGFPADVNNSGGLSPFLTMGQGGNVWEWNETLIGGNYRGRLGGAYNFPWGGLTAANSLFTTVIPVTEEAPGGFRVASISIGVVPEPGSCGLLLLGLAGMTMRRRRVSR